MWTKPQKGFSLDHILNVKKKISQVLINHNHTGTGGILVLTISVIVGNWFSVSKAKLGIEEKKAKPAFATFLLPQTNMCVCIDV